mmetsp:Transcript_20696/g.65292  ORF Transcript_20696/g.65292 Transcript_20696/m.65292 type:complete len:87 (+) Transcript_20696:338-598(+)
MGVRGGGVRGGGARKADLIVAPFASSPCGACVPPCGDLLADEPAAAAAWWSTRRTAETFVAGFGPAVGETGLGLSVPEPSAAPPPP